MTHLPSAATEGRVRVPDEIRTALHGLNNALAAALGRLELCEDGLGAVVTDANEVLRECLHESQRGLLRARDFAVQIAELTCGDAD